MKYQPKSLASMAFATILKSLPDFLTKEFDDDTPWLISCAAENEYPDKRSHRTVPGIAAYRSALTLDRIGHGSRKPDLNNLFENDRRLSRELDESECMEYSRPSAGKIARLMLELLKNLEGDDGIIQDLTHSLFRAKLFIPTSKMEVEPDLDALVQTPELMQGEPHMTLPRVLAVAWMLAEDPGTTKENGWCPIEQLTMYLDSATPVEIAVRMRAVDPILARARYVLEDFMQSIAPMSIKRELPPIVIKTRRHHKHRPRYSTQRTTRIASSYSVKPSRTEIALTTTQIIDSPTHTTKPTYTPVKLAGLTPANVPLSIGTMNKSCVYKCVWLVLCVFVV